MELNRNRAFFNFAAAAAFLLEEEEEELKFERCDGDDGEFDWACEQNTAGLHFSRRLRRRSAGFLFSLGRSPLRRRRWWPG